MRSKTKVDPAKVQVPPGHVLMNENGQMRILELSSGRVMHTDGSLAARAEQLAPVDSGHELERQCALSDYAYTVAMSTLARRMGRKSLTVPDKFKPLPADAPGLGIRTMGERVVTMDLGVNDVHVDAAMPNYAAGYALDEAAADLASTPIVTGKASNVYQTWDDVNAFRRVLPNGASAGGATPEIGASKSNATYTTKPYALGAFLPTEVETNADAPLRPFQKHVRRVMDALYLEREIRVATLMRTTGSWSSGQVIALAAGAKWNGGASADPIRNLRQICETSAQRVTGILMATHVYNAFSENPAVRAYYAYKDAGAPIPDTAEMKALLRLPPIYEAPMKYYASGTTFSFVWGGDVVLFRQPPEMPPTSQDDVSTATTFRWLGGDAPDGTQQGGWLVRTFFIQDRGPRGGRKIVVCHNDAEVMTSSIVGGLITGAYQ